MKKVTLTFYLLLITISINAQVLDSFADGEFTSSPTWTGNTGDWRIETNSNVAAGVNNSFTLQLNAIASASGTKYLSFQKTTSWGTEQSWGLWIGRGSQQFSTANQSIVWLYASESDLTSNTVDGYRIIIGDNSGGDEIILQKVTDGLATNIIVSSDTITGGVQDCGFLLRITRSSTGIWTLYTSVLPTSNGSGAIATDLPSSSNANINQGTATDNTYTDFSNGYIGVVAIHTSGTLPRSAQEFDQFYFDVSASSALPVELSFFKGFYLNGKIILNWRTETELNNYGFEVQRSVIRGQKSEVRWEKIGFVNGNGNSNSKKEYSFEDKISTAGKYFYRLKQIDFDGNFKYSGVIEVNIPAPADFTLNQNYPNPFNPATTISFNLPKQQYVTLEVFNILGQKIVTLLNEIRPAGTHTVNFDASSAGGGLNSGFYVYKLTTENFVQVKKMTLIK